VPCNIPSDGTPRELFEDSFEGCKCPSESCQDSNGGILSTCLTHGLWYSSDGLLLPEVREVVQWFRSVTMLANVRPRVSTALSSTGFACNSSSLWMRPKGLVYGHWNHLSEDSLCVNTREKYSPNPRPGMLSKILAPLIWTFCSLFGKIYLKVCIVHNITHVTKATLVDLLITRVNLIYLLYR